MAQLSETISLDEIAIGLPRRIHEVAARQLAKAPDRIALVEDGASWSYRDLDQRVAEIAAVLASLGIRPGDRMIIVSENCIALAALLLATSRLDAWAIVANPRLSARELDQIRDHSGARRIIFTSSVSKEAAAHASRYGAESRRIGPLLDTSVGPLNESATGEPVEADPQKQVAVLIYTSGTTGTPKGVMLTHDNLLISAKTTAYIRKMNEDDKVYLVLPISHIVGISLLIMTLMTGGTVRMVSKYDPAATARAIAEEEVGSPAQRQAFLPGIMDGGAIWTLAWAEGGSRYDFDNVATTAHRQGDHFVLSGTKAAVIGAPWADKLIVSARTSRGPRDRDGVSLFVVDRHSANLHLQSFKTVDGRRAAEVTLMDVHVPANQLLGTEGEGVAALEACRDRAIAALCAEAVGAMSVLNSATLEYSKARKQFGVALGTFQVLQHRMVDMFIAVEESISLTQHLNLSLAAREPNGSKLASGAKSKVGYAARFVAEQAVQLHGGMGMSDELNVGHYFKRISSINIQFGDPAYHLMRYAQQG